MSSSDILFSAELRNVKNVYNILRAISFTETAVIRAMDEGLKVTVEEMKCVQTSAYIPNDVFDIYNLLNNDDVHFKINLKTLTAFLNMFGDEDSSSLKLIYKDRNAPLIMIFNQDEENITVDCQLSTMEAEELIDMNLAEECRLNNLVVKAQPLIALLHELDGTSEELELQILSKEPYFRISTNGLLGEALVDISPSSNMVEIFRCTQSTRHRYTLAHIKQLEKVMTHASRVSISTGNEAGLLSLQLVIPIVVDTTKNMYVEYYCTSLIELDEAG